MSAAFAPEGTSGDTHNQKDHVFGSLRRRCLPNAPDVRTRSRPRWSPDTRWSGYQAHSLFTISNITRGRCGRPRSSKTFPDSCAPSGGARRDRTDDLMLAKHALSQLSYGPNLG